MDYHRQGRSNGSWIYINICTTKIVNLIPDLMVIKLILQNYSIRTLHFLDIAF